uniref:Ig-like domain-containing protein n=1 Tax=Monodelphis domestica TaxID=13616 RepID=A0A5F8GSB0_MONDO
MAEPAGLFVWPPGWLLLPPSWPLSALGLLPPTMEVAPRWGMPLLLPALVLLGWVTGTQADSKPTFVKAPEDQTGLSGGVASFVCQATGEPKPRITWMKKGKKVSSQRFEVIEFDDGAGSVLRIQPLRVHRDEAIYECTATNSLGEINVSAKLTVLDEDQLPHGFPTIDMGPQLKVVEKARTATMLCAAGGNPDPEISWFKDFLPVDPASSNGRIKQLRSGALQIENSEESDQGKYECVATNSAGTRYSAPANLYVRGKEPRQAPGGGLLALWRTACLCCHPETRLGEGKGLGLPNAGQPLKTECKGSSGSSGTPGQP